jgi:hypothetical protein
LFPNVYLSAADGYEADDVIHTLAKRFSDKVKEVLIYGYDKDLAQNVTEKCFMWSKCEGSKFIKKGVDEVKGVFEGCLPVNTPFYRSICGGDSSDSVKSGYKRFPHKLGVQIANLFGCPNNFLKSNFGGDTERDFKWVEVLRENPDPMVSLYSLMKSRYIENLPIYRCNSSWEYIHKYKLEQVRRDFEKFLLFADNGYTSIEV